MNTISGQPSTLMPDLVAAYRATRYEASDGHDSITLTIDQYSPSLARLLERCGVQTAAFITGCNPYSQSLSDDENDRRHGQLLAMLNTLGVNCLEGWGRDVDGIWPPERSALILGLSREQACAVGQQFQQNAIVFIEADAVPRLLLLV